MITGWVLFSAGAVWYSSKKSVSHGYFFRMQSQKISHVFSTKSLKYRSGYRKDIAQISCFSSVLSEFQVKFGLKSSDMSNLPENTYHVREIDVFCTTDVFHCDFVSFGCTRGQNRVHVNKNEGPHFCFARKCSFLRYFSEKLILYRKKYRISHTANTYRTSTQI